MPFGPGKSPAGYYRVFALGTNAKKIASRAIGGYLLS